MAYNSLVHIPINAFLWFGESIKRLNLEENHLSQIPMALRQLNSLEVLNLNGNKLIKYYF